MYLTPNQTTVFHWLDDTLDLPVFAQAYKGALHFLNTKAPGFVTFVSHAGRDLMNGLAPAVAGFQRHQVQYVQLVGRVGEKWDSTWVGRGLGQPHDSNGGHLVPYKVCQLVEELLQQHNEGRERRMGLSQLFFAQFFDYTNVEQIPAGFYEEWKSLSDWFQAHAHTRKEPFREEELADAERHFRILDTWLHVAASSEFERLKEINEILEDTNG